MPAAVKVLLIAALLLQQATADEREIQRIAMDGWLAARAIAPRGGALDLLGPVNQRLRELDAHTSIAARYAETVIRAAVSAAQDERDEMGLFLEHARGLSDQMALIGTPAKWPLPIDEVAGELWFEVDRYVEARDAYERALKLNTTPNALVGLARAADKLGDRVAACAAYTRARDIAGLPAAVELEISMYMLKCQF
jgi:tetratricopeptide (TPR) repeat protein